MTLEERQVIDHSARVIASTLGIVFLVGLTVVIKDSAQEVVEMGGRIREALPSFGDVFLSAQCGIGEQVANPYCKVE